MLLLFFPLILAFHDLRDLPCPVAEDIAPCTCVVRPLRKYRTGTTMDLSCNDVTSEDQLAEIFEGYFPFKNFQDMVIKRNDNLTVLRTGVFGDLTFERFMLSNNQLQEVQEGALSGSFNTSIFIDLRHNKISSFPFHEIEGFSQLELFYINYNRLEDIPTPKSTSLVKMNFQRNRLYNRQLTPSVLRGLPNLKHIDFGHTYIKKIASGTFAGLPHLHTIELYNNNIEHIPAGAFQLSDTFPGEDVFLYSDVVQKPLIDLQGNRISSIEVGAVIGIKQGKIDLSYNKLEELDEAVFKPLIDDGNSLVLTGNPLKCGCDIKWVITDPVYMEENWFRKCHNGTKLRDLDPQFYEQNC